MNEYHLEYIFTSTLALGRMHIIGALPEGLRANVSINGGEVSGEKVRGIIHPMGGNWSILRTDGVFEIDYRLTFETHDGALIYVTYIGVSDFGEDAYQKYFEVPGERGQGGSLSRFREHRVGVRCSAAHPSYQWLNRLYGLGIGHGDSEKWELVYDVYAVQ